MKSVFSIFLLALLCFFFSSFSVAQSADELVKTVFNRTYDKKTIQSGIESKSVVKQKTAILAAAHSGDSTFIPVLVNGQDNANLAERAFALSKLPYSQVSVEFLFSQMSSNKLSNSAEAVYSALGKLGLPVHLERLCTLYEHKALINSTGISLAIYYFAQRNIRSSAGTRILKSEINKPFGSEALKHALFALYRLPVDSLYTASIQALQNRPEIKTSDPGCLQYFAGVLRRYKIIPKPHIQSFFANHSVFPIRVEAARLMGSNPITDTAAVINFLSFFNDNNENVIVQAAQSLHKDNIVSQELRLFLADKLFSLLEKLRSLSVKMQVLSAILRLEPSLSRVAESHFNDLPTQSVLNLSFSFPNLFNKQCFSFCQHYESFSTTEKYTILSNISGLKKIENGGQAEQFSNRVLLSENSPVLLAVLIENMDSTEFAALTPQIIERIMNVVKYNIGNTDFTDYFAALIPLALKVNLPWCKDLIALLRTSTINSIAAKFGNQSNKNEALEKIAGYLYNSASVRISTTKGDIVVKLDPQIAPVSAANFLHLATTNYFNGIVFHRVVPGFVIQTGDPTGTGSGGPGYEIISELSPVHYKRGILGMARSDFNTEGSQWFITTGEYYHLDGNYTVFGSVTSGLDVAEKITQDDRIIKVSIIQ